MNEIEENKVFIGVNWGAIERRNILGKKIVPVDLDVCCVVKNTSDKITKLVYYATKSAFNDAISHSGDDFQGDRFGDDGLDNEIISVELDRLPEDIKSLTFILNSYSNHEFSKIPFTSIRLYTGNSNDPTITYRKFDISENGEFADCVSMILGLVYKSDTGWSFALDGTATDDQTLEEIIHRLKSESGDV